MSTNYEKFLAGVPLTEELAKVRDGTMPMFEMPVQLAQPNAIWAASSDEANAPLAKNERNALREMRLSAGWPVFQKLWLRAIMRHTAAAVNVSQVDPLHNSQAIAETWAYLNMLKRAQRDLELMVELETRQEAQAPDESEPNH